jgi:hypothetical protein
MLACSRRGLSVTVGVAIWLCCGAARAEDDAATRQAARKLAEDGVAALQNGDAATAVQKLEKAHQMLKVPSVALWSARALVKRGLLVEAAERLRDVGRLPSSGEAAVQEQAKREAEKELSELSPRIPSLVILVEGAQAVRVTLDGNAVPAALLGEEHPVNPGPHHVVGTRGAEQATADVTLAEAEHKQAKLSFGTAVANVAPPAATDPAAPPARSAGGRTLAYVALGAGALGLVVGGASGALAIGKKGSLDDNPNCRAGICTYAAEDDVKSLRTFRTVSTIGFVAGGVLAATGVVLLLTGSTQQAASASRKPALALRVGPGHLHLLGGF